MVESTKPAIESNDEPEILGRYSKTLPKGQYPCGYSLKMEVPVEIERTPDGWIASVDVEGLHLWGAGGTEEQATDDLVCVVGEVRDSHRRFEDSPTPCPARELKLLEDMVA